MLLRAMDETGVEAAQTVMVGDTVFDIEMAANAGVPAVGVSWGYHAAAELEEAGAALVIDHFAALAAAVDDLTLGLTMRLPLLKIMVVLVVAVIVAIAAILFAVDPNDYKPEITSQVRKVTGRELVLAGDIDLRPGLRPRAAMADVALGNADWGSRPGMVKVGQFEIQVALFPLVQGELVVDELILRDADILLETDGQGRGN